MADSPAQVARLGVGWCINSSAFLSDNAISSARAFAQVFLVSSVFRFSLSERKTKYKRSKSTSVDDHIQALDTA
jgi:hypothetical protein